MLSQRLSKCLKTNVYYKSLLVINFVHTCSLLLINNGMYTIFSYDTPQRTGQTDSAINRTDKIILVLQVLVKSYGQQTYIYQKQSNTLDPTSMQKQHFPLKFYAENIIFPCI